MDSAVSFRLVRRQTPGMGVLGMIKHVYLHIGAHKTGTTALQQTATENRAALRHRGLDYPEIALHQYAHHKLPFALVGNWPRHVPPPPEPDVLLADLRTLIDRSPCPRVLLSSEEFMCLPRPKIARIGAALQGFAVTVIVTLRRPDALYLSSYNQKIKQPFNDFIEPVEAWVDEPWKLCRDVQFLRHVTRWSNVFGQDAIRILLYEDIDVVIDPLRVTGVTLPAVSRLRAAFATCKPRINRSVPGLCCQLMLLAKSEGIAPEARRALLTRANGLFHKLPPLGLAPAARLRVLTAVQPETDALFARYGMANPYAPDAVRDLPEPPPLMPDVELRNLMADLLVV